MCDFTLVPQVPVLVLTLGLGALASSVNRRVLRAHSTALWSSVCDVTRGTAPRSSWFELGDGGKVGSDGRVGGVGTRWHLRAAPALPVRQLIKK